MAARIITGFHTDEDGHWVAELSCGHGQHVRHRPPWEVRAWVTTENGRAEKIGAELDCLFCDMPALPAGVRVYKTTRDFDEETTPRALRDSHDTKPGVWGRIVVESGKLAYEILEPAPRTWILRPGVDGIIAPTTKHRVRPEEPGTRFRVEFLRAPT